MKHPILYVAFLITVIILDWVISTNFDTIWEAYSILVGNIVDEGSSFLSNFFSQSILRYSLSVGTIATFGMYYFFSRQAFAMRIFFSFESVSIVILIWLFVYLNSYSPNSNSVGYGLISYFSLILLTLREQLMFMSQILFASKPKWLFSLSVFGLAVFIYLHPHNLTLGRVTGTILMINLWIYTTSIRNIWQGVAVHAIWNYAYPESAAFHYVVLVYSFWLAFGRLEYPDYLKKPFHKISYIPIFGIAFRAWRQMWLLPTTIFYTLKGRLITRGATQNE